MCLPLPFKGFGLRGIFRHNERATLIGRRIFYDFSGKWIGRGQKNALECGEHVCLILRKAFIQNLSEHRAFSTVVVLIAVLVLSLPLAKRNHEHAKGLVLSPEPVLDAGTNEELIVGIGMMDLPIELQMGAVIKEMEKLVSDLVRMQTGTFAWANEGQVNGALLVANHHINITPGTLRLDCMFSLPRVGIFHNGHSIKATSKCRGGRLIGYQKSA